MCAAELPKAHEANPKFTYLQLPLADNTHFPLDKYLPEGLSFIESAVESGGRVLLHCAAGSSRSGSMAIAYKMKKRKLSYEQAEKEIKEIRPIVLPNPGFTEVLQRQSL